MTTWAARRSSDLEYTKTAADEWSLEITDEDDNVIGTAALEFDSVTGRLSAASDNNIQFDIPGTAPPANVTIDLAGMSQLATGYNVSTSNVNGSAPSQIQEVKISGGRHRQRSLQEWRRKAALPYPAGGRAEPGPARGAARQRLHAEALSRATSRSASRKPASLARSSRARWKARTWISASELTNMIESQRNYTANSKIFQTGSDLLDVLVNLEAGNVPAGHEWDLKHVTDFSTGIRAKRVDEHVTADKHRLVQHFQRSRPQLLPPNCPDRIHGARRAHPQCEAPGRRFPVPAEPLRAIGL